MFIFGAKKPQAKQSIVTKKLPLDLVFIIKLLRD